jgi:hypothetical protein
MAILPTDIRILFTNYDIIVYFLYLASCSEHFISIIRDNGAEAPKGLRPIVFKEWRDTRTFSNLKSTHCTLFILLIINLVTKKSLCI